MLLHTVSPAISPGCALTVSTTPPLHGLTACRACRAPCQTWHPCTQLTGRMRRTACLTCIRIHGLQPRRQLHSPPPQRREQERRPDSAQGKPSMQLPGLKCAVHSQAAWRGSRLRSGSGGERRRQRRGELARRILFAVARELYPDAWGLAGRAQNSPRARESRGWSETDLQAAPRPKLDQDERPGGATEPHKRQHQFGR